MLLHGIWLINYPIKDGYIFRSCTTARHKMNTTVHLILFRKGTVRCKLLSSNKTRIHFIYNHKSLGKLTTYCLYFLEIGQERNMYKQYASLKEIFWCNLSPFWLKLFYCTWQKELSPCWDGKFFSVNSRLTDKVKFSTVRFV